MFLPGWTHHVHRMLILEQMAKDWARLNTEYTVVGGCESGFCGTALGQDIDRHRLVAGW
jgi:hypothetical protein